MTSQQIIVLSTPVFLGLMALEWWIGRLRGQNTYRLHDAMASMGLGIISQLANFLARGIAFGTYVLVYREFALWELPTTAAWVWISGLLLYDLCFYCHHRAGHRVAFLWATHAVHHQSEDYNLSTALRQPATNWLAGWVFYLPLAILGYPPQVIAVVGLIDILYQFWIHTELIGRMRWLDGIFNTPSNHRVHHAVNEEYLDRNYGGILILWDRCFGTYSRERPDLPCVYGTRTPLKSWNPLRANFQVFASLLRESSHVTNWRDKLLLWIKPPGWRPADVAARYPKVQFEIHRHERYDPVVSARRQMVSVALFLGTLAGVTWLQWNSYRLDDAMITLGTILAVITISLIGWLGSEKISDTGGPRGAGAHEPPVLARPAGQIRDPQA